MTNNTPDDYAESFKQRFWSKVINIEDHWIPNGKGIRHKYFGYIKMTIAAKIIKSGFCVRNLPYTWSKCGIKTCINPDHRTTIAPKATPEEVFWKYVQKTEYCWTWLYKSRDLVYSTGRGAKTESPRAFSYKLHIGDIPNGFIVKTSCGNGKCVNPKHLYLDRKFGGGPPLSVYTKEFVKQLLNSSTDTCLHPNCGVDIANKVPRSSSKNFKMYKNLCPEHRKRLGGEFHRRHEVRLGILKRFGFNSD